MRNLRMLGLVGLLALSACGAPAPSSTTSGEAHPVQAPGPEEVLADVFESLRAGDYAATSALVDERQLGLLAAIEVPDASAFIAFQSDGLTAGERENFWSSFAGSMPGLRQSSGETTKVTIERQFATDGERFAIGQVRFGTATVSGVFVLRLVGDEWRLDPIATFGGAFVAPIRNWLRTIPGDQFPKVSAVLRRDVASWRVLADLQTEQDEAGIAISREVSDLLIEIGG